MSLHDLDYNSYYPWKALVKGAINNHYGLIIAARGCGKTICRRALMTALFSGRSEIDRNTISLRWCEYFEIPNYRGRKNYLVYMAKIERYILPKACSKWTG